MEVCGIDPATRGRRTDESLEIIRGLLTGEPIDFHGEFYDLDAAHIVPAPDPTPPIMIGGRSDATYERTARFGDGWLSVWSTADRAKQGIDRIEERAAELGRTVDFDHGLQMWSGIGDTKDEARRHVAERMEAFYRVPFEKFERYAPYGSPEDVADFLRPLRRRRAPTLQHHQLLGLDRRGDRERRRGEAPPARRLTGLRLTRQGRRSVAASAGPSHGGRGVAASVRRSSSR